jgi:hypothetical protein
MNLEPIEVGRPELAISRKPVVELCERFWPDAVQATLRVCAHVDEPGVLEDAEMLGHGRLADAEAVDELPDRPFAFPKQIEDRQPTRLRKDLECGEGGHADEYSN